MTSRMQLNGNVFESFSDGDVSSDEKVSDAVQKTAEQRAWFRWHAARMRILRALAQGEFLATPMD
jgi:hypothetical protein